MQDQNKLPIIGVAVIAENDDGRIIIMKRKGKHGDGKWALPGGKLEFGESINDCAVRETLEETGLNLINPMFVTHTEDIFKEEGLHFLTMFVLGKVDGEPTNLEPEKCSELKWEYIDDVDPEDDGVFLSLRNYIKKHLNYA